MKWLVFGDTHTDFQALKKVVAQKADLYICLGDLSDIGRGLAKSAAILAPLKNKLWLMPGNNEAADQVRFLCQKHGFFNFHQKMIKQKGYLLGGFGYSTPTPFNTVGEFGEKEFAQALKNFAGQKNLCLFLHNPPKETELDVIAGGVHVGSQAIKDFIIKHQPLYCFSGHIHENEGKVQRVGKTTCFGVGKKGLAIWL